MVNALVSGKRERRNQLGFTLAEFIVAIAVSALIVVGSLVLLRYMIAVAADNRDKTMATLQVQYVGFWISEDVVQAQTIELGDSNGFPLIITWTEWDGDVNEVTYTVDTEKRELERGHKVNGESYGTSVVSEYLDPGATECSRRNLDDVLVDALVLEVTATVDRSEASSTYEIHPRAFVVWE